MDSTHLIYELLTHGNTPSKGSTDSAGYDLTAATSEAVEINPNSRVLIPTGLKLQIPTGYRGEVCSRSGLAITHGVIVLNAPGIIDSDYRGEIGVILYNTSNELFRVTRGMRIAQLCITKTESLKLIPGLVNTSVRGVDGFGSTGY